MERRIGTGFGRWRMLGWGGAVALILTPLVAMQFTSEVNWDLFDFIFAAVMFGSVGIAMELAIRASRSSYYHVGAGIALLTAFAMIWSNLAVGIVGNEDAPVNLLFFAVVAIGIAGGSAVRFGAGGLSCVLLAAATVQALIGTLVLLAGRLDGAFALGFVVPMLLSAALFRAAAREASSRRAA